MFKPNAIRLCVVLGIVLAIGSPTLAEVSEWHGLVTPPFAQTSASASCCDDPTCVEQEFGYGQIVSSSCYGTCEVRSLVIVGSSFTRISGESEHDIFSGNFSAASLANVDVYPVESGKLPLQYKLNFGPGQGPPLASPLPSVEVVVFRYAGSPQVFDGQIGLDLDQLLQLGFITYSDVLYLDELTANDEVKSVDVDLAGVPASDVVVLASGYGVIPSECNPDDDPGGDGGGSDDVPGDVPASSRGSAILLMLGVLAISALMLKRYRVRI